VRRLAPDTVRMMLTGNADQQTALEAVNEGHIFRFLTKPCPAADFGKALEAGLAQHRLITAERELLSKTMIGSVKVLTDVLSLVSPTAFGRSSRVRCLARDIAKEMGVEPPWTIEMAAMLSQIGCVAIPQEILVKAYAAEPLSQSEAEMFAAHPMVGRDLLKNIPRLEEVAEIVAYQEKQFNGEGPPRDDRRGEAIPLGGRVLKVVLDFDTMATVCGSREMALAQIHDRQGWYDPRVLAALRRTLNVSRTYVIRQVKVHELIDGTTLADDVCSMNGTLLCAKGQEVTAMIRARLRNYVANIGIQAPIKVFVAVDEPEAQPGLRRTAPTIPSESNRP